MARNHSSDDVQQLPPSEEERVRRRARKRTTRMVVDNPGLIKQQHALRDRAWRQRVAKEHQGAELDGLGLS
jgi:hypothetical protein